MKLHPQTVHRGPSECLLFGEINTWNVNDVENEGFTSSYLTCKEVTCVTPYSCQPIDDLNLSIFSPSDPCSAGEGDCEVDADCEGTLRCGFNNCGDNDPTGVNKLDGFHYHC